MDLETLVKAGVVGGGVAVTLATEIMKSKYIPVPAQHHPRTTAAIASIIASGVYVYHLYNGNLDWRNWLPLAVLTLITSAVTYKAVVK